MNMMVTVLPKYKPLRVNPQTNGIRNRTHGHGSHTPQTNPNYSNYKVGIL